MTSSTDIYHYTNYVGLEGIIRTASLYATDAAFLNDSSELRFGADLVSTALKNKSSDLRSEVETLDLGGELGSRVRMLESAASSLADSNFFDTEFSRGVYVVSFSGREDALPQWRGYGGEGGGVCLGFDRSTLTMSLDDASEISTARMDPGTLRYRGPRQVMYGAACHSEADSVAEFAAALPPRGHPGAFGYGFAYTEGIRAIAIMKHAAFKEENEYRIVVHERSQGLVPVDQLKFRVGKAGLIPYLTVAFPLASLRSIRVGPGADMDLRMRAIAHLLRAYGHCDVEVVQSEAPYRP